MKNKLQQTSKRYLVVPIVAIGLVAILAFSSADEVSAYGFDDHRDNFAQAIAQKFNLNQSEVEDVMDEYHQQNIGLREQEMLANFDERLDQALAEGKITESQMYAILEKHEEMHDRIVDLRDQDLDRDELHELKADIHDEMEAWADEQGIDYDVFMRLGNGMARNGGRHMMR